MKEWDLSELMFLDHGSFATTNTYIYSRTVQEGIHASELDLKTFLDHRFVPSAREAFAYAADQDEYETLIRRKLRKGNDSTAHG